MKLLIVSDIHGSGHYARKIKEIYEREMPDKLVLLGDLYYHGPKNDLTLEYAPMEVSDVLNSLKDNIIAVRGNCDAQVDEMISDFRIQEEVEMNINNKKVLFTHGHIHNIDSIPDKTIEIMFYGHFHTGFIKKENGIIFANPGSISLPKDNTEHSYLIFDENELILKDLDGNIIESYHTN